MISALRARGRFARRRYRFEQAEACLCGAHESESAGSTIAFGHELELRLCTSCGLGRLSPRLAAAELDRYYREDYRRLERGPAHVDESYFERGVRRGEAILDYLGERDLRPLAGSSVVEIGTGSGGILQAFRRDGYDVVGCDLDPECVAFARERGLAVTVGERLDAVPAAPVSLVVLSHLVEHLPDPGATLVNVRGLVDGGGLVYVEVPGLRGTRRSASEQIRLPHLYYYDATTLEWLFARAGFERVDGDETVRALYRPAAPSRPPTDGNLERNRDWLRDVA